MSRVYVYGARRRARNFMPQWIGRECVVLHCCKKPRNCLVKFLDNGEVTITNIGLLGLKKN